jgi:hypothetical protein
VLGIDIAPGMVEQTAAEIASSGLTQARTGRAGAISTRMPRSGAPATHPGRAAYQLSAGVRTRSDYLSKTMWTVMPGRRSGAAPARLMIVG